MGPRGAYKTSPTSKFLSEPKKAVFGSFEGLFAPTLRDYGNAFQSYSNSTYTMDIFPWSERV